MRIASLHYNATGTRKTPYRYPICGYSIGGPAYIPKRFNTERNKLFFFLSQEFDPITTNYGTRFATTPTTAERNGDFSRSYHVNGALIPITEAAVRTFGGDQRELEWIQDSGHLVSSISRT